MHNDGICVLFFCVRISRDIPGPATRNLCHHQRCGSLASHFTTPLFSSDQQLACVTSFFRFGGFLCHTTLATWVHNPNQHRSHSFEKDARSV